VVAATLVGKKELTALSCESAFARIEVLTAVLLKIIVLWDVMLGAQCTSF
jgi:hypothetical protein